MPEPDGAETGAPLHCWVPQAAGHDKDELESPMLYHLSKSDLEMPVGINLERHSNAAMPWLTVF